MEFVLFPGSGHVACFEEPRWFLEVMLRVKELGGFGVPPAARSVAGPSPG